MNHDLCTRCADNCLDCENNMCLECAANLFRNVDGRCVEKCKAGEYGDLKSFTCESCMAGCRFCDTLDRCNECSKSYFNDYLMKCQECEENCAECTEDDCLKCSTHFY